MDELHIEPTEVTHSLTTFIRQAVEDSRREGAIVGLSGGIDSAVVAALAARALGPERVLGLILPERDSAPESRRLARKLAQGLGIDLQLSGHTHGGQVRLPGLGAIHTQGTHLRRSQAAGWFTRGATRMFVTRGIGESLPLRLAAPPQAAVIRVVPG